MKYNSGMLIGLIVWVMAAALIACNDDDTPLDGPPPTSDDMVTEISAKAGEEIIFTGTIKDENGLKSFTITYTDWFLDNTIELTGNPTSYDLYYAFRVPADATEGEHIATVTATNFSNKSTSWEVTITIGGQREYDAVYAVGGFMWWWGWDYPDLAYEMLPDQSSPKWFETTLPVWGGDFNTLKFLGQPSWDGDNWGLVSSSDPGLGMVNSATSEAIILDDKGLNPAYYHVRFNPSELRYTAEELVPNIPVQPEMFIVGNGFPDYPALDWNPEEAIPMQSNYEGYGEHLYGISGLSFSDDVSIKFIGQNTGWGPIDVGFMVGGEVNAPISWVATQEGDGTADLKFKGQAGSYTIVYDRFAGRALIWKE